MSRKLAARDLIVEGTGQFPLDMLRYDSCFPATLGDVDKITMQADSTSYFCRREINLITIAETVSPHKWMLWGWIVVKETPVA